VFTLIIIEPEVMDQNRAKPAEEGCSFYRMSWQRRVKTEIPMSPKPMNFGTEANEIVFFDPPPFQRATATRLSPVEVEAEAVYVSR
jgi:hypothetical protein